MAVRQDLSGKIGCRFLHSPPVNTADLIVFLWLNVCFLQTSEQASCYHNNDRCGDACDCNITCIDPNPAAVPPERGIDFLTEGNFKKFLFDSFIQPLTDAVGLGRACFGAGVINIFQGQVQLVIMSFYFSAVLCAAIGQNL